MDTERNVEKARFAQLGFVLRAYRTSFIDENGRTGISQEELLRRMSAVDPSYGDRFSHATVSRWEAGATRPTVDRLRTIGQALKLPDADVAGLILLAGLAPDFKAAGAEAGLDVTGTASAEAQDSYHRPAEAADGMDANPAFEGAQSPLRLIRVLSQRFLAFALFVVGSGYALSALGWNGDWMPVAYIFATTGLVMVQGFVFPDRDAGLRDFFWVSLFLILAVPSLQFAPLQMDHYGFYAMGDLIGTHVPFMLSLVVSLVVAAVCALMFQALWRWRGSQDSWDGNPLSRALWAVLPPIMVAYAVVAVLSNASVWIQSAVVMSALAGMFIGLLVMRDPSVNPNQNQRRFLLHATFTVALVGSTVGMAVIVAVFMLPDIPKVLPDHNLLGSWEIDFDALGYTEAEALERLNVGYMWHAIYLYVYMVLIVGVSLLIAVYRLADGDAAGPGAVHSETSAPGATARYDLGQSVQKTLLPWPTLAMVQREMEPALGRLDHPQPPNSQLVLSLV